MVWLGCSGLKGETVSLITAAQDQALNSCYHQMNTMNNQLTVNAECAVRQNNT